MFARDRCSQISSQTLQTLCTACTDSDLSNEPDPTRILHGPCALFLLPWQHAAWALAARIVFAISPNSASCERVFALLKNLFGDEAMSALADYLQAGLMLNYNKRIVG